MYLALQDYLRKSGPYVKLIIKSDGDKITATLWGLDDDLQPRDEIVKYTEPTLEYVLLALDHFLSEFFNN